jgi:hypothetical protein
MAAFLISSPLHLRPTNLELSVEHGVPEYALPR